MLDLLQETTEANPCYPDASHQIRFSYIVSDQRIPLTSLDIVLPSLVQFGFMLLYYYFCDVCSNMLTSLFCMLFVFFNDKDYKKYDWL